MLLSHMTIQKVIDVIDELRKAGRANLTDVVVTYDDTSKRVTVRCTKDAVLELRRDIARILTIHLYERLAKRFTLALPKTGNQYFYVYTDIIKSDIVSW